MNTYTPTHKNTSSYNDTCLPHSLVHTHTPKYKCWINVVLNLAYYNRSANASWVNRCPGHSSLLSYKAHRSCRVIYGSINTHARTQTAHTLACITTCLHILSGSDSSLQGDYEALSSFVFGPVKLQRANGWQVKISGFWDEINPLDWKKKCITQNETNAVTAKMQHRAQWWYIRIHRHNHTSIKTYT